MRAPDPIPPLKQQLARELVDRVHGWRLELAASLLGIDWARVSKLRNGRLQRFSLERLIRCITHDHGTVTLHVTWKSRRHMLSKQRDQRLALRTARPGATPSTKR
jgi:predicted XRE-type DNA-binding protein